MISLSGLRGDGAAEAQFEQVDFLPVIAFVSKTQSFSDRICRITQAELGSVRIISVTSISDVIAKLPNWEDWLRMVVVDETTAGQLHLDEIMTVKAHANTTCACAYVNEDKARQLLSTELYPQIISSVFPLDLNLDAWVSMLKFCLAGHTYVKPELLHMQAAESGMENSAASGGPSAQVGDDGADVDVVMSKSLDCLTKREKDVLAILAKGCQNKIIATRLGLSENTVKLHIHHIISKLGVHNRTEAAMIYARRID